MKASVSGVLCERLATTASGVAACRDVQVLGLRNTVNGEISVHRERCGALRRDLRADEGPRRKTIDVEEVGGFERPIAIGLAGCNAARIEHSAHPLRDERIAGQHDFAVQNRNGTADMFHPNVRDTELRGRMFHVNGMGRLRCGACPWPR